MHDWFWLVAIVWILAWPLNSLAKKVPGKGYKELLEEMRKLREEVQALRRENHDLILGFDTTLRHTERRLDHLEGNTHSAPVIAGTDVEPQRVTFGR